MNNKDDQNGILPLLSQEDPFTFSCHNKLECFSLCCRNINIFLTPYDVLRIRKRLSMTSESFLKEFTIPIFIKEVGHPVLILKMSEDKDLTCPFINRKGCTIYSDRPWSCRSFPIQPISQVDGEENNKKIFSLSPHIKCLGLIEGKRTTVKEWMNSQELSSYEKMNNLWSEVTHHEKFNNLRMLNEKQRELFYLGSFDLDRFREYLFQEDHLKPYNLDSEFLNRIKTDDEELLKMAFRWLKAVLFDDKAPLSH